jgi:hypothetical protein
VIVGKEEEDVGPLRAQSGEQRAKSQNQEGKAHGEAGNGGADENFMEKPHG